MAGTAIANQQRLIANEIEQLDIILNILNDNDQRPHKLDDIFNDKYFRENKSYILPKDLILAIEKLCLDKYVDKIPNEDWRNENEKSQGVPKPDYYRITYSGRLFLKNTSSKFKSQPYQDGLNKARLNKAWTIFKIAANVSNTIAIIAIGIIGLILTNQTSQLQRTVNDQTESLKKQRITIDSLIKIMNDTTRLEKIVHVFDRYSLPSDQINSQASCRPSERN